MSQEEPTSTAGQVQTVGEAWTISHIDQATAKLMERFLESLLFEKNPELSPTTLRRATEQTFASVFGKGTTEYLRFESQNQSSVGAEYDNSRIAVNQALDWLLKKRQRLLNTDTTAISAVSTESLRRVEGRSSQQAGSAAKQRIFIVHGHDTAAREAVARFVEKLGFEAVVLQEQPNHGRTIMEKFEQEGNSGFAIAILTPDDVGSKLGAELRPRGRQNVIFELGYFIGRLGRAQVCALVTDVKIELPSDFSGVVWEHFDDGGAWRIKLGQELDAAGFVVDWNAVMKRKPSGRAGQTGTA